MSSNDNTVGVSILIGMVLIIGIISFGVISNKNARNKFKALESTHEYFMCVNSSTKFVGDKGFINGRTETEVFLTNGMVFRMYNCEWLDEKDIIKGKMNGN